jgi:hypothetical protein
MPSFSLFRFNALCTESMRPNQQGADKTLLAFLQNSLLIGDRCASLEQIRIPVPAAVPE